MLSKPAATPTPVLDPRVAYIVRSMMMDVADLGTGVAARQAVPASIPVAGKTGTTNDNVDVWFVGMTPNLVAGVWLGFDTPSPIMHGVAGGTLAAPIWGDMIAGWPGARGATSFPPPPIGLTFAELDRATGQPAADSTPPSRRYVEWFIPGTEPDSLRFNPWKLPRWGALLAP